MLDRDVGKCYICDETLPKGWIICLGKMVCPHHAGVQDNRNPGSLELSDEDEDDFEAAITALGLGSVLNRAGEVDAT
jgi:hypothetical protein